MARRFPPDLIQWLATAIAALVLGLWQLASAWQLAIEFKSPYAETRIRDQLGAAFVQADRSRLQRATEQLLADPDLGLEYLAVTDEHGGVIAVAGQEPGGWFAWLPPALQFFLRDLRLFTTASFRQASLADGAPHLGEVHYMITPRLGAAVRESAVKRLAIGGFAALLIALASGRLLLQRRHRASERIAADWRQRMDPDHRPQLAHAGVDIEGRISETLQIRVGSILDEMAHAMIVVDREGVIRYLNATAGKLTGWNPADVIGRGVYTVFHPFDGQGSGPLSPAEFCLRESRVFATTDVQLRLRDGSHRIVQVTAAPLRNPNSALDGAVMLFHDIGEREARNEQLRRQWRLSQSVIDHLVEGVLTTDPMGVIRFANARAQRLFGYSRDELEGAAIAKLLPVPFLNAPAVQLTDYISGERSTGLPKVVGWRRDATTFPVELVVQTMTVDQSQGLLLVVRDITERQRSENLAQRLGRLLDAATEEVYIFDASTLGFVEVNRGARRNLGYHPSEMTQLTPLTISLGLDADTFIDYLARLRSGEVEHLTYRCRHRRADGSDYPVEVRLNFSREEEPPVFMAIAIDITEREQAEQQLRFLAHHDTLTGLPNRSTLNDRLAQALLAAQRSSHQVGLLFMDVDRFKQVNDDFGHEVGDAVLQQVAQRLSSALRASDTVARYGGDEFVVIASGLRAEADAVALARKLQRAFETPLELPGRRLLVSLSIGVAIHPLDPGNADQLLHHADLAMYQAKQAGPGQFRIHGVDVEPERQRQLKLERGISAALALGALTLELLPVVDERGAGRALLAGFAWQHAEYGRIDAAETLTRARREGLRADVETWRLASACARLTLADAAGLPPLIVPLSTALLRHPDFAVQALELARRHQLPRGRLILAALDEAADSMTAAETTARRLLVNAGFAFDWTDSAASASELASQSAPAWHAADGPTADTNGDVDADVDTDVEAPVVAWLAARGLRIGART